ncbi:hypothetical protein SAMN04515674_11668 [Pseudarcicella hirudinis]|uniref:Uncharacterized protein n=1 Tax=Pseudarcicella hirudinis TaxID=1079859 RepID=A0A1I5XZP3_9BACT|nr:hypothetical protein [Pseudarcicella hirudinis]SFQ37413.1 hypothetical protein SAMN04515674_11668 [Pseudarcicella hirudinis]
MEPNSLPLEKELEPIFLKQLPAFPDNVKDLFVKIAPFLAIIWVIFGVAGVGLTAILSPFAWFSGSLLYGIGMLFLLVMVVLDGLAIPGLLNKTKAGWTWIYYAQFASVVFSLLMGNWIGGIIRAFIGFWILFQIREKYS